MEIVVLAWSILLVVIVIQVWSIIRYVRKDEHIQHNDAYSPETLQKTQIIVEAIKTRKIKKHIITNSAPIYDSQKTLTQYRKFLSSELMKDLLVLSEETYNG